MLNNVNTILAGFIIVMCVVFAYFMLFTDMMKDEISGTKRIVFVVILLAYGTYRAWRLYKSIEESKKED